MTKILWFTEKVLCVFGCSGGLALGVMESPWYFGIAFLSALIGGEALELRKEKNKALDVLEAK